MERLAPIVMHALGWVQHRDDLDADAPEDLLHTELGELEQSMAASEDGQVRNLTKAEADDEVLRAAERFARTAIEIGALVGVLVQPNV